jgi:hypothetical protein
MKLLIPILLIFSIFSLGPEYQKVFPEETAFCEYWQEKGEIEKRVGLHTVIKIPCDVWLDKEKLEKFINDCYFKYPRYRCHQFEI